jgi:hypothetical protein
MKQLVSIQFQSLEDLFAFKEFINAKVYDARFIQHEITCYLTSEEITRAFAFNVVRIDVLYKKADMMTDLMLSDYFDQAIKYGIYSLKS